MTHTTFWRPCVHDVVDPADNPGTVSWLLESGSITARLRRQWPDLKVTVLDEGMLVPTADERARLGLGTGTGCWVREVRLHDNGHQLIHARTVIPAWGDSNPWKVVGELGRRPLGELLFGLPDLTRSPLEFALAAISASTGASLGQINPARRCVFEREGAPLLLTEAFECLALRSQEPCPAVPTLA